jgi:DNA-binding response OmpR family regulator
MAIRQAVDPFFPKEIGQMKILIITDGAGAAHPMQEELEKANYTVDIAEDGRTGLEMALKQRYQLIIVGGAQPGCDRWRICEALRTRRYRTPILMLMAEGADDYLPRPFDNQDLLVRVRSLLMRDKLPRTRVLRIGDLEIDTSQHRVKRAGAEIGMSQREYDLLEALATFEGKVLTREAIQERIWMNEEASYNIVNVYIGMLRKKIDANHKVKLIQTVYGVGYTLRLLQEEETI